MLCPMPVIRSRPRSRLQTACRAGGRPGTGREYQWRPGVQPVYLYSQGRCGIECVDDHCYYHCRYILFSV